MLNIFKLPERPKPSSGGDAQELHDEPLFGSYPHATLAFMAAGCGAIAVTTLVIELATGLALTTALELPVPYLSLPVGVGTMILAGLVARNSWRYAVPALALGGLYWVAAVIGLFL